MNSKERCCSVIFCGFKSANPAGTGRSDETHLNCWCSSLLFFLLALFAILSSITYRILDILRALNIT